MEEVVEEVVKDVVVEAVVAADVDADADAGAVSGGIGKGTRVRIVEGEHADVEGEIFWWGRSRWGHGMRAGVTPTTDEKEKLWVDATELRAIDDEGNELDPQPMYDIPPAAPEIEIRGIEVAYGLARAITAVRLARGYPAGKAISAGVRLHRLNAVEANLGCRIPDAVIAYVVSGLGSIRDVGDLERLTKNLMGQFKERPDDAPAEAVVFEADRGCFYAFIKGAEADDTSYVVYDSKRAYAPGLPCALEERLLDELGGEEIDRNVQAFEVVVDYITEDEPEEAPPAVQWITHKKFGRGVIQLVEPTSKGDKLTVRFEDGELRKLMDSFVEYE